MSHFIKKWITNRTGLVLNMDPTVFGRDVRDGIILARILRSYHIITQDQLLQIIPTDNSTVALKNLRKLCTWLKTENIEFCEADLYNVAFENGPAAIKLFYQLYLMLQDKDKLYFIAHQNVRERLRPSTNKFEVTPVEEPIQDTTNSLNYLSMPLVAKRDAIDWTRHRYEFITQELEATREKYMQYVQEQFGLQTQDHFTTPVPKQPSEESDNLDEKFPECEDDSYDELIRQEQAALQMIPVKEDKKAAKKIVNTIKQKHRKETKERDLKRYQQKMLLLELWEKQIKNQEKDFEECVSKKMLKQSLFEKQMMTKMMDIRQQKQMMLEHRRYIDQEIQKKKDEEFLEHVFLRQRAVVEQKSSYYFERDRALELHRRLYAERLRLQAERHLKMCSDIMNDMLNVVFRYHDFKKYYDEEVPKRIQQQWANLFVKQQPVFDLLDDATAITANISELPPQLEEIYRAEIERQDALDDKEFEDYDEYHWPWIPKNLIYEYDEEVFPLIDAGMNVLGHAVHRVLLTKYPKPQPMDKLDLPKPDFAVCINGVTDLTILPVMQKLVNHKKIRVIEMQEAINYCLEVYKAEIRTEFIDKSLEEETEAALKQSKNDKSKSKQDVMKGDKGDKKNGKGPDRKRSGGNESLFNIIGFEEKASQTPKIYPCEEIVLSPAGELGKTAYDVLNIGEPLTDNLVVAIFVEFLKTLKDVKGWVLINFPTTLYQATILEEALTGIQVPGLFEQAKVCSALSIGDIADLEYRESQWDKEEENAKLRKSKIVPNPDPIPKEAYYNTYLTAYIHVQPKNPELELEETPKEPRRDDSGSKCLRFSDDVDTIPCVTNNAELLEQFYMDQGCNYNFYYITFDIQTIKHLCRLVIGDYSIPRKSSLQIFGDTVRYIEDYFNQVAGVGGKDAKDAKKGEKKLPSPPKEKEATASPPDKGGGKGGRRPTVEIIAMVADKATQMPEIEEPEQGKEELPEPLPGEKYWDYPEVVIPAFFQIGLATFWKKIETVYLSDMSELFFIRRLMMNALVPYLNYIKNHMVEFIARPDDKQSYLYSFQEIYNQFDADMREDDEVKAELHCRIAEFREKLWGICDYRMKESEEERQRIIDENWVSIQCGELCNNFITAIQLEIDRCCDSYQFLSDYYIGCITKMPSEEGLIQKTLLNKLVVARDTSLTSLGNSFACVVGDILKDRYSTVTTTPYHHSLEETLSEAYIYIDKCKTTSEGSKDKWEAVFKGKKGGGGKDTASKKSEKKLPKFTEPEPEVKEASEQLIAEWNTAITGEYLRCRLRIEMLVRRGVQELNEIMDAAKKVFYNAFDQTAVRYQEEIDSVNKACEAFAAAIEAEVPLQPEMVFCGDKFYIDPTVLLFPKPLPPPEIPLSEKETDDSFSIAQLEQLRRIFMSLAPHGSMPERAFTYLLQDMVVHNAEDGKPLMLPLLWLNLNSKQVAAFCKDLWGDSEFIDWKDFIIYNFCVDYPTEDDILEIREQFLDLDPDKTETIRDYQFYHTRVWFERNFTEDDTQDMFRLKEMKELIFRMYKVNEDTMNYTSFLLDCCKSTTVIKGLVKALTLSLGRLLCWDLVRGETYVKGLRDQKFIETQEELAHQRFHEQAVTDTTSVVGSLIGRSVHECDSVIIDDYVSETGAEEEKPHVEEEANPLEELYKNQGNLEEADDELSTAEFSNIDIGYEPSYDYHRVYFIGFEDVLTVLTAALPWHARSQTIGGKSFREKLEEIYESCRNPEFDNCVLTYELLHHKEFKAMLCRFHKFIARNPPKIVTRMLQESDTG